MITEYGELASVLLNDYEFNEVKNLLANHYQGEYKNDVAFAQQLFDECYGHQVPSAIVAYIDYHAFAYDLFIDDYFTVELHGQTRVFSTF